MRTISPAAGWHPTWLSSYQYDLLEVFGSSHHRGYSYAYENRRAKTLSLVQEAVAPGSALLDVAAAQGNFSIALAELGYRVTWNDLRAELIDYVKLKHDRGSISYAAGNAFELRFPQRFDAVLATEVMEHVAHPEEFLRRLAGLVRPGGYVVITTPNGAYFRNRLPRLSDIRDRSELEARQFQPDSDGHLFLLHANEIRLMAGDAGLELERMILFTNPLTAGHMKLEHLLRVLPRGAVRAIERCTGKMPRCLAESYSIELGARLRVK